MSTTLSLPQTTHPAASATTEGELVKLRFLFGWAVFAAGAVIGAGDALHWLSRQA